MSDLSHATTLHQRPADSTGAGRRGFADLATSALELALRRDGLPERTRASLQLRLARAERGRGNRALADTLLRDSASTMERLDDRGGWCAVLAELSRVQLERCQPEAAEITARSAVALDQDAPPRARCTAALRLGESLGAQERWREAHRWYQAAIQTARLPDLDDLRQLATLRLSQLSALRGDTRAAGYARMAAEMAMERSDAAGMCEARAVQAYALALAGRTIRVPDLIARAIHPLRQRGATQPLAETRVWVARAWLAAGRPNEAFEAASRARAAADEFENLWLRQSADALIATTRARAGQGWGDRRLGRVLSLAVRVAREPDASTMLGVIADAALELLDADRAFVLVTDDGDHIRLAAGKHREGVKAGRPSMSVVQRALRDRREVLATDVGERADLREQNSVLHQRLDRALCVPMPDDERVLGALYVDSQTASQQSLLQSADLLRALAAHAAVNLVRIRMHDEREAHIAHLAEVAHDLRSPIATCASVARELLDVRDAWEPWVVEALEDAAFVSDHALDLTDSLLQTSSGANQRVALDQLIARLVSALVHDARRHGVAIVLDLCDEAPVRGDPRELSRVVTNLVDNAVRHSPPGSTVTVRLRANQKNVCAWVRDRGPGIPAERLAKLFRQPVLDRNRPPGHGLGLYIARSIMRAHGGTVSARNHPDGGAELRFELPRDAA